MNFCADMGIILVVYTKHQSQCVITWKRGFMKGYVNTNIGEVSISNDVIANYAGSAAVECFGIVGMASLSMINGLATLLKKDSLSKGVEILIENNEITAKLHIIVAYGVSISAVAENLIENVRYKVEEFTGMKVKISMFT